METYDIGDRVRMQLILKDYGGALTDGTVTCSVKTPAGVTSAATVTNPATGVYHAFVTITEAGTWRYRFASTGATISAGEGSWQVGASAF